MVPMATMESLQILSKKGLEHAQECLSLLKYSEGLIKRDIELARMQLELKLRKLESLIQDELKEVVENENFKVEEIIADMQESSEWWVYFSFFPSLFF